MSGFRLALLAPRNVTGDIGGAERFYAGLLAALRSAGVNADLVEVLADESSFEAIEETYLRCYDLDLSRYDAVISTKAPTFLVRHPNHICYLVHTMRVFYDLFEVEVPRPNAEWRQRRTLIHQLDTGALQRSRTKQIFSIGGEVAGRLRHWNSLDSEVLHPALAFDSFHPGPYGDYLLLPGRLHRWKRVDLVIKALRYVRKPVRLLIAGLGEDEPLFREQADGDERVEFLGRVSDEQLVDLYAGALAVPFVPLREDYGYVTLEAFRSAKPVITCTDSGEPAALVRHDVNGFVCRADPRRLADAINRLYESPDHARRLGEQGKANTQHIRWPHIVGRLLQAIQMHSQ
jgi:glycosyltransferase involved in cell wall biosynthesis